MEYFNEMEPMLRTFWFMAIPTSVIFIIQSIMTFIGADATDGLDADFDGDLSGGDHGFQIFSLRNLINFLLGFSWMGISFYDTIETKWILILLSLVVGVLFVAIFFVIIRQLTKLAEDNSFRLEETVGLTAQVYLTIPEEKKGKGKVLISVRGSTHELDAMTDSEKIETSAMVRVKSVMDKILFVEKL